MATIVDKPSSTTTPTAPAPRRGRLVLAGVALAAVAGVAGWQAPTAIAALTKPPYLGENADKVATKLACTGYTQSTKHDNAVYDYRDQGTCTLNGVVVTITTFDTAADGKTFDAVMSAVIPVLHPTWSGASYASGDGWNVADTRNLTPEIATEVVTRLGIGATHVIPAGASS
ncbi:hypothetical protein ABT369_03010 [Dactylosporangium sp. NPDC000244]|uniref:hypothetical protein n=1 Tax=Dactylosporangium sp. NPDC000244 TaxID=3154365 RepID=UPI00332BECE9